MVVMPGFERYDPERQAIGPTTPTTLGAESMNPSSGDSHVLDRWCMNRSFGELEEAKPTDIMQNHLKVPEDTAAPGAELHDEQQQGLGKSQAIVEKRTSAHWTQQAELRQGCGITPADLTTDKCVIYHRESQTMYAVAVDKHQTVQDLLTAEATISDFHPGECFDILGHQIAPTTQLTAGQFICIGGQTGEVSDKLTAPEVEQIIQQLPRWCSLCYQGGRVAHDEMQFYMQAVSSHCKAPMVEPLMLDHLSTNQIAQWQESMSQVGKYAFSAILAGHHWIPIVVERDPENHIRFIAPANSQSLIACVIQQADIEYRQPMPHQFQHDCGFQTFAWLIAVLEGQQEVHALKATQAVQWRQLYWQRVYMDSRSCYPRTVELGGHEDELLTAISTMLKEHGVGLDQVQQRARAFINKAGHQELQAAVVSSRPWQTIKRIANECKPPFRLVLQPELDKVLAEKAKTGKPVGSKQNKIAAKAEQSIVTLGPENVTIPRGVFAQIDGNPLQQIATRQVSSKSAGIVVVSEADVQPFLPKSQISEAGLAFLVLNPSAKVQQYAGTLERFPAQCSTSGEPMLVSAYMLQRGGQKVVRAMPQQIPKIEEVPVTTVKLIVFRDQLSMNWQEFCEAPVKQTLKLVPCFQKCRVDGCDCEAWHPSEGPPQGDEPVLDIWNRDFLNQNFKKTNPKEAVIFACAARIHTTVFEKLCTYSGSGGLYIEPRSSDGRSYHPGYHTVWLSKMGQQEAVAAKATTDAKVILVRVQQRYGLKVKQEQASQVHSQFHGDAIFLGGATKILYTVGPMPWGASRAALVALFKSWEWQAKPLQAIGKSADQRGLMWSVQAMQAPPASVVTMEHGDVLLVRKEPETAQIKQPPSIEASVFTKKSLQPASSQSPLTTDPWAEAAKQLQTNTPAIASPNPHQLAQIEKQVEQRVWGKLQNQDRDVAMPDAMGNRVQALEAAVQKLHDEQTHQQNQTAALSQQVAQVQGKFEKYLDGKLAEQMNQIEALLSKRSRHE